MQHCSLQVGCHSQWFMLDSVVSTVDTVWLTLAIHGFSVLRNHYHVSLKVCPHLNWIRTGLQTESIDANRNRIQCAFIASTLLVVLLTKRFQHACLHMIVTRIVQSFYDKKWVNLKQIATQSFLTVSGTEKCAL